MPPVWYCILVLILICILYRPYRLCIIFGVVHFYFSFTWGLTGSDQLNFDHYFFYGYKFSASFIRVYSTISLISRRLCTCVFEPEIRQITSISQYNNIVFESHPKLCISRFSPHCLLCPYFMTPSIRISANLTFTFFILAGSLNAFKMFIKEPHHTATPFHLKHKPQNIYKFMSTILLLEGVSSELCTPFLL